MNILVVDDHAIVRAGLRRLMAGDARLDLREAADGKEALALFRERRPQLVILDLNLPGIGGLELIKRLKLEDSDARILVLSMHDDAIFALRALQAGALGYVSKNAPPDEIQEGIQRVADGQSYVARELAQELAILNTRSPSHPLGDLSRRELEIVRLLGEGRSLHQIAEALGLSYKTIANNCAQIKAKLGVERTAELIRIAVQNKVVSDS
jgi:two-component system, NarL family, invasion response regulator UvrY